MEIAGALIMFFIFVVVVFLVLAFFLPEWVGITGNKAKEIMSHQNGENEQAPSPSKEESLPPQKE